MGESFFPIGPVCHQMTGGFNTETNNMRHYNILDNHGTKLLAAVRVKSGESLS